MTAGSPKHRCCHPGCDKRALYAAPKTGKLKAGNDHDLCKRHWQAAIDRAGPRATKRNSQRPLMLGEMRAIVRITAEVWGTTPQMVVKPSHEKGARKHHIAMARTASANLIRDLLGSSSEDLSQVLKRHPCHVRWMVRKANDHLIYDRHFNALYGQAKTRIHNELSL